MRTPQFTIILVTLALASPVMLAQDSGAIVAVTASHYVEQRGTQADLEVAWGNGELVSSLGTHHPFTFTTGLHSAFGVPWKAGMLSSPFTVSAAVDSIVFSLSYHFRVAKITKTETPPYAHEGIFLPVLDLIDPATDSVLKRWMDFDIKVAAYTECDTTSTHRIAIPIKREWIADGARTLQLRLWIDSGPANIQKSEPYIVDSTDTTVAGRRLLH